MSSRLKDTIKDFIKPTLIGGLIVLLPSFLLFNIVMWLLGLLHSATLPIILFFSKQLGFSAWFSQLIGLVVVLGVCFLMGMAIRNRLGAFIVDSIESMILNRFPGYKPLKDLVGYFLSPEKKSAFSQPALINPWGDETWLTGFVMDEGDSGLVTVFIPTAPNPSTGLILHLPARRIKKLDISGSEAFKSIIACGVGSASAYHQHIS